MKLFAELLQDLVLTRSRNRKIDLLVRYLSEAPDPDRGLAVASITGDLKLKTVQPAFLRNMMSSRMDETLFRLSYDYVGDMAETIALLWKQDTPSGILKDQPSLSTVVDQLLKAGKNDRETILTKLMGTLGPSERYAMLKLATGGLRIGVSARLAKQALASYGKINVADIEEIWHGMKSPYLEMFEWLDGKAERPVSTAPAPFRPVMLSHPLEERDENLISPELFAIEWKWDGIRVQVVNDRGTKRLFSRTGDDISKTFPDITDALTIHGTFDGELLVRSPLGADVEIRTFSDLQQRLNRKTVTKSMMDTHPAFIRLYDVLFYKGEDFRDKPYSTRRRVLEQLMDDFEPARFDLSPTLDFTDFNNLRTMRSDPPSPYIEGLMIKKLDSTYKAGRPRGFWFKWKRDPMVIDAVLMYAQRGHGKRSGYYSDFTFGCWKTVNGKPQLLPVGKAYFGFTDEELKQLDKFVRENTVERFGPVRSVTASAEKGLVLEIAFEGISQSKRHKSGVAMRFPRISRIRWDKPSLEADSLDVLNALI